MTVMIKDLRELEGIWSSKKDVHNQITRVSHDSDYFEIAVQGEFDEIFDTLRGDGDYESIQRVFYKLVNWYGFDIKYVPSKPLKEINTLQELFEAKNNIVKKYGDSRYKFFVDDSFNIYGIYCKLPLFGHKVNNKPKVDLFESIMDFSGDIIADMAEFCELPIYLDLEGNCVSTKTIKVDLKKEGYKLNL